MSAGNLAIPFNSQSDTVATVLAKIATFINDDLYVTFTPGTAPFTVGADGGHPVINTVNFTSLANLAGETFSITTGTNTYTFEFVDAANPTGPYGIAVPGDIALSFDSQTDNVGTVLQDIANAINNAVSNLIDTTATPLDGDDDGVPGGQYNYWFNAQQQTNSIYVNKTASSSLATGAAGSITNPYTTISAALAAAAGPVALGSTNGDINVNNSTIAFTYTQQTSPFPAGTATACRQSSASTWPICPAPSPNPCRPGWPCSTV